ncbi:SDR family oxidoreductase [Haloarculaceae archaeon H-GB1-1]|nr:SDR family oxidoreductase [Haloarculaceae archaeon H-GB1-1]
MELNIDGNAALVTASTSGMGLASAEALAREGANVAICGRTPERLTQAREQLADVGEGDVLAAEADVTAPDDVAALVEATVEEFGGLDHLVMSAGDPASGRFLDTTNEEWIGAMETLVMSVVYTAREAHAPLEESDAGTMVAITATSAQEILDAAALSNSMRRAVSGLLETLAREFAPEIRVNEIQPGPTETESLAGVIEDAVERGDYPDYETGLADWATDAPLGRVADPQEIGDVAAFLSSPRASYVTGASLPVDGGTIRS